MGRIVVTEFISLDGVIEAPGGNETDFPHAGWFYTFDAGDDGDAFNLGQIQNTSALLLGRVTYDFFAEFWPTADGPIAEVFNRVPKYVVSSTLTDPTWSGTTVLNGDFVTDITELKESTDGNIGVSGSGLLAQGLIAHDLVDQIILIMCPIVLGSGARLFANAETPKRFRLTGNTTVGEGVAILTLQKAS
jgi:dihydrofolate reductase